MSEWISMKKKRPAVGDHVIATGIIHVQRTSAGVAKYQGRKGWLSTDGALKASAKITHWMPLPDPPEEG